MSLGFKRLTTVHLCGIQGRAPFVRHVSCDNFTHPPIYLAVFVKVGSVDFFARFQFLIAVLMLMKMPIF